jgi:hypothetical protein
MVVSLACTVVCSALGGCIRWGGRGSGYGRRRTAPPCNLRLSEAPGARARLGIFRLGISRLRIFRCCAAGGAAGEARRVGGGEEAEAGALDGLQSEIVGWSGLRDRQGACCFETAMRSEAGGASLEWGSCLSQTEGASIMLGRAQIDCLAHASSSPLPWARRVLRRQSTITSSEPRAKQQATLPARAQDNDSDSPGPSPSGSTATEAPASHRNQSSISRPPSCIPEPSAPALPQSGPLP